MKNNYMIRLILVVFLIFAMLTYLTAGVFFVSGQTENPETVFVDVDGSEWYVPHITPLVIMGLISGYPDGTFRPNTPVTVAEFVTMTVRSIGYHPEASAGEWFEAYVSTAEDLGIIEDGDFDDYNRAIMRDEMAAIAVKALDESPRPDGHVFSDETEIDPETLPYVRAAFDLGLLSGYPDNSYRPRNATTRAEASVVIVRVIDRIMEQEPFMVNDALELENEFFDRLLQESENGFDNREALIDHLSEISDRNLAEGFVDEFYDEMDGEFVLIPRDGPIRIFEDEPYDFRSIHPREYVLTQQTHTVLTGDYTLTVTYTFENRRWIIKDRHLETPEGS